MIRPAALWLALALASPAFFMVATGQQEVDTALITFLIAVPVSMIMLTALRFVTAGYGHRPEADRAVPGRRATDQSADEDALAEPN
ncbi:hypothetical protein [Pilimelia columellifera]|uniref:Uncharacterized protein n=1 Tax=Pilimelia columellifera subsp. columellifera TaxID=706583 RepID=A0ABP6AI91_9ACTN